ncbi:hypothetical protein B0H14DRAFT_2589430 [Mycena olivaceomarginata]|nr:hypothetical protein B0H14DRAFT_2589430 [Mycena olivaceomarginata]
MLRENGFASCLGLGIEPIGSRAEDLPPDAWLKVFEIQAIDVDALEFAIGTKVSQEIANGSKDRHPVEVAVGGGCGSRSAAIVVTAGSLGGGVMPTKNAISWREECCTAANDWSVEQGKFEYARKHFGQQIVCSMTGSIERYFTATRVCKPRKSDDDGRLRGLKWRTNQHLALKTVTKLTCIFLFYVFIVKPGFKTPGRLSYGAGGFTASAFIPFTESMQGLTAAK